MKIPNLSKPTSVKITAITPTSSLTFRIGALFLARNSILSSLDESKSYFHPYFHPWMKVTLIFLFLSHILSHLIFVMPIEVARRADD
jgi:hypothetical protein